MSGRFQYLLTISLLPRFSDNNNDIEHKHTDCCQRAVDLSHVVNTIHKSCACAQILKNFPMSFNQT